MELNGKLELANLTSDPGSPVEGQLYYNTTSKELKVYNGTTWDVASGGVAPASPGMVRLDTQVSDGLTNFEWDLSTFDQYDFYKIVYATSLNSGGGLGHDLKLNLNQNVGSNYNYRYYQGNGSSADRYTSNETYIEVAGYIGDSGLAMGEITINRVRSHTSVGRYIGVSATYGGEINSTGKFFIGGNFDNAPADLTHIKFSTDSGIMTKGQFILYGYNNS